MNRPFPPKNADHCCIQALSAMDHGLRLAHRFALAETARFTRAEAKLIGNGRNGWITVITGVKR